MKKILSTLLVAAMLLSLVIVAAVPAAADDDSFWTTYGRASHHAEDFDGDRTSIPGYEYNDDGFHMTAADWSTATPWGQLQTSEPVNLKDGVYMQVVVNNFTYGASDKWFNFNLWKQPMIDEGSLGWGEGVQTIIRTTTSTEEGVPGSLNSIGWYIEEFTNAGGPAITDENRVVVDGMNVLTLIVTYDTTAGYGVTINGVVAPEKVITYMNEAYGENADAYVGFAMHSSEKGGTMDCTVTKWGTSEADAQKPTGTASKDPENFINTVAEIADASTVEEGKPAILMTGNKAESDIKGKPVSATGATITINEDYTVHVVATKAGTDAGIWRVANDVSYDIADFPVVMYITKNFCTCGLGDECMAFEESSIYMLYGEELAPAPGNKVSDIGMCENPYVGGEDSYLYFYADMSVKKADAEGRINGLRIDFTDVDISTPGANAFDIVAVAYFRDTDEAEAFADSYLRELGAVPSDEIDDGGDDIGDGDGDTTEAPVGDTTEAPVGDTTEAPDKGENTTEAAGNQGGDKTEPEGGCGSVVGFSAIAVVAVVAAAGFVSFKKKED